MASGKPFKPSITATRISFSPRWLSSFMTPSQNLAPSLCWIQIPSTSLVPSLWMPNARYTALFLTVPSSRILTLKASKNTTGYIGSKGRFCHSMTSARTESVTVLIRSVDTSTLYCSSKFNLAHRHSLGVHRDNLGIESSKTLLAFADELGFKPSAPISCYFDLQLPLLADQRLFAAAIAVVFPNR